MKTEVEINAEIQKHKQAIKENLFKNENDVKISKTMISALEWVLNKKEGKRYK